MLEDITAANTWGSYRGTCIPTDAEGFILERMESAWMCGAYAMLSIEARLRRETPARGEALKDRLLAEVEKRIYELDVGGKRDG